MTIKVFFVGKTDSKELRKLFEDYTNRLKHYVKLEITELPDLKNTKNLSENEQKLKEGTRILEQLENADHLVVLDENGKQFTSMEFSGYLQKKMNSGLKNLVFVVGGSYGFHEAVLQRSNAKISLSPMTFSHQMVRLFFIEQVYRAFTILRNEPYHHR
ncbi:23S rRNA (pseudouridine(1915)-N(3))-methyltransferase RlmH [Flavobacteriaceae bacterium GF1]